jgi:hypothetical protein
MVTALRPPARLRFEHWLSWSAIVGTTSLVSLFLGFVPSLNSPSALLDFNLAAYAQSISDQEVQSYARSLIQIEPIRQQAYDEIQTISGEVPAIRCDRPSSLQSLPSGVQQIAIDYCNQAIPIVENNNLSIERFNQITIELQSDPGLEDRIQKVIQQMQ